jgi:hypothetical protein
MLERFDKNGTDVFFTSGLNKKMNTTGLNITEIVTEATKYNMTLMDVAAITEEDGWQYTGQYHDGESYVCSSWVTSVWKAAGLFGENYINAVEWSPKDVYQVDFFNKTYHETKPEACKQDDPNSPWCQLRGKYRMTFPGFSELQPYPNMNDHCPSMAPEFIRPDNC